MISSRGVNAGLLLVAVLLTATSAFGQQEVQSLQGDYLGLAALQPKLPAIGVVMEVKDSHDRHFDGRFTQTTSQEFVPIQGTIAASGKCTIQADSEDARTSLHLDWMNLTGAGVLLGVIINHEEQIRGPVALLRPFEVPGIDWSAVTQLVGTRTSAVDGTRGQLTLEIDGAVGLLQGLVQGAVPLGPDLIVVGTSNGNGATVIVGAHPDGVMLLTGQVKINERGEPVGLAGDYLIETSGGKLLDAGMFVTVPSDIGIASDR